MGIEPFFGMNPNMFWGLYLIGFFIVMMIVVKNEAS